MQSLFTPWRFPYLSEGTPPVGCFFCDAAREPDDADRLVVDRDRHHLLILNRYPYTNGHLMLAPIEHLASPDEESAAARAELWPLVLRAQRALTRLYSPQGFNLGMNLGSAAGAGVPEHFHLHIVPRWRGDTNFMSVVGGTRLIPDDLESTWSKLREIFSRKDL